jgi:hypothetical protein
MHRALLHSSNSSLCFSAIRQECCGTVSVSVKYCLCVVYVTLTALCAVHIWQGSCGGGIDSLEHSSAILCNVHNLCLEMYSTGACFVILALTVVFVYTAKAGG